MGQQQLLLIVLTLVLVAVAIAIGVNMFQAQAYQSNVDAMVSDLNNFGAAAQQYLLKPQSLGGGNGTFIDFGKHFVKLGENLTESDGDPTIKNSQAVYVLSEAETENDDIIITATSNMPSETTKKITVAINGITTLGE